MKLLKTENPYLSKDQWRKVFLAVSIMTIVLYAVAMIFSLCGSNYFILNYQNAQMDKIEAFLSKYNLTAFFYCFTMTLEATIMLSFVIQKFPKWYYVVFIYAFPLSIAYLVFFIAKGLPSLVITLITIFACVVVAVVDQIITTKKFSIKVCLWQLLRLVIALAVMFVLQAMIYVIKAGYFSAENHTLHISAQFIYTIEYDIALSVILATISLYINREKGDSKVWITPDHSGSSQTSKMQLQKSLQKKNLTKTQRNKLRWLFAKVFLIQTLGFLILMVLPFLLGKVFEFLVMYTSFAIVRYILGFKYSLHYKKESVCIAVGVAVFGILSLAVPFFYVVVIMAITIGSGLAVLLHLSYKYKGMWLFNKMSKPDRFALLYVFFDGDLEEYHVKNVCKYKGLDSEQTLLIWHYVKGDKISYLAFKFNYSQRMINYKLDEAIEKLTA